MIAILISLVMQHLNFAKSPLTPTLSRLREREFEPRIFAIMPSPASGISADLPTCGFSRSLSCFIRGCTTVWERGYLATTKWFNHAK